MENYERKYKEALDWMRELYPTLQGIVKEDAEHYFSELKEPEDERIRKEIIQSIQDNMCVIHKDKCIAWLEKQGEHTKFRESIQVGDKVTRNEAGDLVNLSQLNRVAKEDEKQGAQKPSWNEEDEKKIMWLVRLISTAGYRELDNDKMPCSRSELLDWLKSLKDRVQPRPKQEMTELQLEDTKAYQEGVKEGRRLERQDIDKELDEAYKSRDEVVYLEGYDKGYDKGYEDALKDLPKWKKATENKDFDRHVLLFEDEERVVLTTEIYEDEYYIELDDLKTLPKEE